MSIKSKNLWLGILIILALLIVGAIYQDLLNWIWGSAALGVTNIIDKFWWVAVILIVGFYVFKIVKRK